MTQTQVENKETGDLVSEEKEVVTTSFITENPEMKRILKMAENAATSRATILITGASGTGKNVLANFIHAKSHRSRKANVEVNCASLPGELLEHELFGYEKGAFNGAFQTKVGKFEVAHGSTMLVDEISEMDGKVQAKFLRALQDGKVERVGGKAALDVNVRIVATSNRDLKRCIDAGTFRKDLFYRINVVPIHIPPLKARKEDIIPLLNHYLKEYASAYGKQGLAFTQAAYEKALAHSWPGNVRELQNAVSRAVLLTEGDVISDDQFTLEQKMEFSGVSPEWRKMTLDEIERWVIIERLKEHNGNRTHSSRALGISIRTLRNKIREYKALGIDVP